MWKGPGPFTLHYRFVTCGPFFISAAIGEQTSQIQSITDESRSSIRRKNRTSSVHSSGVHNQSSQLDDDNPDEVERPGFNTYKYRFIPVAINKADDVSLWGMVLVLYLYRCGPGVSRNPSPIMHVTLNICNPTWFTLLQFITVYSASKNILLCHFGVYSLYIACCQSLLCYLFKDW